MKNTHKGTSVLIQQSLSKFRNFIFHHTLTKQQHLSSACNPSFSTTGATCTQQWSLWNSARGPVSRFGVRLKVRIIWISDSFSRFFGTLVSTPSEVGHCRTDFPPNVWSATNLLNKKVLLTSTKIIQTDSEIKFFLYSNNRIHIQIKAKMFCPTQLLLRQNRRPKSLLICEAEGH